MNTSSLQRTAPHPVYITGVGKFLPGKPITNDEVEDHLGRIGGKPSRAKNRVLKQNGIVTRHFAIDREQRTRYSNSEMAANAVRDALARAPFGLDEVQLLAAATTAADLLVPGFASQVHQRLGGPACELATAHGVCASGMVAMRAAQARIAAGLVHKALACASEFPSRLFKASRYEQQARVLEDGSLPFDTEFLRWMLSDGAGAVSMQNAPHPSSLSLRIDWMDIRSHAPTHGLCMTSGAKREANGDFGPSWIDFPSFEEAAQLGVLNLSQDVRQIEHLLALGVEGFLAHIERGAIDVAALSWVVCHFSSHVFVADIQRLLDQAGIRIPEERWFSNLATRGNTGSASVYLMLEELVNSGRVRPGDTLLCVVPESGGFITSYMHLTAVGPDDARSSIRPSAPLMAHTEPAAPVRTSRIALRERVLQQLLRVWIDFESRLNTVPVLAKLKRGVFTHDDYQGLLINLRQQVVEGSRWIARAASHVTSEHLALRSSFLRHAVDEHRDFEMLERHFCALGGSLEAIRGAPKNIGSEALSAWIFQRASHDNPFDLLGAMFIIEGIGSRCARPWGESIRDQLRLSDDDVRFFLYHGANDDDHLGRFHAALDGDWLDEQTAAAIVKTAKVTARLYLLQLEELGNA